MENPESKWYRKELSEELNVLRAQGAPEAAKTVLNDQQKTVKYQEAEKIHKDEQHETFRLREELDKKRKDIEDLKKKLNELEGGILKEEQILSAGQSQCLWPWPSPYGKRSGSLCRFSRRLLSQ